MEKTGANEKLEAQNKRLREKNVTLRKAVKMMAREFDSNETIREQYIEIDKLIINANELADGLNAAIEDISKLESRNDRLSSHLCKIINEVEKTIEEI